MAVNGRGWQWIATAHGCGGAERLGGRGSKPHGTQRMPLNSTQYPPTDAIIVICLNCGVKIKVDSVGDLV